MRLEIDGVPRYTYSLQQNANNYPTDARIWFGDGTLYAGGTSEWLSFSHNAAAPVAEPASALLMAAGCAALLWRRRRAARRTPSTPSLAGAAALALGLWAPPAPRP